MTKVQQKRLNLFELRPRLLCSCLLFVSSSCYCCAFDPPSVFPVSTRQALAQKSKQLNQPSQYSTAGWSNRAATALTPVQTPGVYTADRPFYWNKIDVGCRCTVIELPSSGGKKSDLWVHSPVAVDGPLMQALDQIGSVRYVVSPNYEHVKFAPQWQQTYPDAQMWGCPGLAERLPQVKWTGEIPFGYRPKSWTGSMPTITEDPPIPWDTSILQPLHIDCELNPFTGRPFFNEVIYYHEPSKTLLTTDLFWNYPTNTIPNSEFGRDDSWELAPKDIPNVPWTSRLWKFGMDRVYSPFFNNFMVTDRQAYHAIANHIINVWDVETVIPAHGDILRGRDFINRVLKKHFQID